MINKLVANNKKENKKFNKYLLRHNSFNFGKVTKIFPRNNNYLNINKIQNQSNKNNFRKIKNTNPNNSYINKANYYTTNNSMNKFKDPNINNTLNDIYKTINKINNINSKIKNILSHNSNYNTIDKNKEDYVYKKNNYSAQNTINNDSKVKLNFKNPDFFNRIKKLNNNSIKINNKIANNNYYTENNNNFFRNVKKYSDKIPKQPKKLFGTVQNKKDDFIKEKEKENNYLSDYESSYLSDFQESIENNIDINYNQENYKSLVNPVFKKINTDQNLKLLNKEQNNLKYILNKIEKANQKTKNFINSKNPKRYKNIKDILLLEKYKQIEYKNLQNINNIKKSHRNINDDYLSENKIQNLKYKNINRGENYYNLNTNNNYDINKYFKLNEENEINKREYSTNIYNINENNNLINRNPNYKFNIEIDELDDLMI